MGCVGRSEEGGSGCRGPLHDRRDDGAARNSRIRLRPVGCGRQLHEQSGKADALGQARCAGIGRRDHGAGCRRQGRQRQAVGSDRAVQRGGGSQLSRQGKDNEIRSGAVLPRPFSFRCPSAIAARHDPSAAGSAAGSSPRRG